MNVPYEHRDAERIANALERLADAAEQQVEWFRADRARMEADRARWETERAIAEDLREVADPHADTEQMMMRYIKAATRAMEQVAPPDDIPPPP